MYIYIRNTLISIKRLDHNFPDLTQIFIEEPERTTGMFFAWYKNFYSLDELLKGKLNFQSKLGSQAIYPKKAAFPKDNVIATSSIT